MADTTNFGRSGLSTGANGAEGIVTCIAAGHDKPGAIKLQCYNASNVLVEAYIWIDSDGVLRINPTYPADQDADGTVVGAQT